MISIDRTDFNNSLAQITNLDALNASGGVAAWGLPPKKMRAFNPIVFHCEVFYAVTASRPAPSNGIVPNFGRKIQEGGTTRVRFDYPVASTVVVTFEGQQGQSETKTLFAGQQESDVVAYYAEIVSIRPASDTRYLYLTVGESYDGGSILITSTGVVFYRDADNVNTVSLEVAVAGFDAVPLVADTYKGVADIDVGAVVRTTFGDTLVNIPADGIASGEGALGKAYTVNADNAQFSGFMGINAVAQIGESADMTAVTTPLTLMGKLYKYPNYELSTSVISGSEVLRLGIGNNGVAQTGQSVEVRCVPPAPFYVRWVNTLGGVDYWMFAKSQQFAPSVGGTTLAERYVADPATATSNRQPYAITTTNAVTVGAEGIPTEAWEALRRLPFSPLIEWWNEKTGKWVRVTVAKYDGKYLTDHTTHSLEVEFNLPAINTQF